MERQLRQTQLRVTGDIHTVLRVDTLCATVQVMKECGLLTCRLVWNIYNACVAYCLWIVFCVLRVV